MTLERQTQTLLGPDGVRVILDRAEIFPDDPGRGTPAMVYGRGTKTSATYDYARGTGCFSDDYDTPLTEAALDFLDEIADRVNAFLYGEET